MLTDLEDDFLYEEDKMGMTVTAGCATITKDKSNLIGISIGGGAPLCPCLYIVQVFDGTPAALQGSLASGDEILAINSVSAKGKTKVELAKMIQSAPEQVTIHYNKLHANPEQGKTLDIILKKFKHRLVESMSSNTADTLGLSRAILCNDALVKRLEELEGTEIMYKGLVEHARRMLKAHYDLLQTLRAFGDIFVAISVREPQQRASEAFRAFGELHRGLEKEGLQIIQQIKPVLDDMGTYLYKAIPDTKMTVNRYADAKFTYLSYCLKVKEMDDEEHAFAGIQEPLYRVETGNYEYRLILRCRQDARCKFAKLRTDVLEKMELLECKHANDLNKQLRSFLNHLMQLNRTVEERIEALPTLFPIEVDFKETDFQYKSSTLKPQELDDDEIAANGAAAARPSNYVDCGLEAVEQPAVVQMQPLAEKSVGITGLEDLLGSTSLTENKQTVVATNGAEASNEALLKQLGLFDIDLTSAPQTTKTIANNSDVTFDFFVNQSPPKDPPVQQLKNDYDLMSANSAQMDLLLQ